MPDYTRLAGSTDVSVVVFIFDPATGLADTTVTFSTTGLTMSYRREGAVSQTSAEVTLAALTTAHTDWGFIHIGAGYYRYDLPDAAVASGSPGVLVHGVLTSRVVVGCYIHLVAYNPQDTVRLGLTALPNVASGSAGAIPTTGTGANQIAVSSGTVLLSSATETQIDDILVDTAALDSRLTAGRATNLDNLDTAVSTRSSHTAANVADAAWDESRTGHATSGTFGAVLSALPESTAGSTGGLSLYDNIFSMAESGTIADATPTTTGFNLSSNFSSSDDAYNGSFIIISSGSRRLVSVITDYVGASRTATLSPALTATPVDGDGAMILGLNT